MTKYILVGGYPDKALDEGKAFCEEVVKGFEEPVRILDCIFARPHETWEKEYVNDKEFFGDYLPNKKPEIRLADPEKFIEQVKWANAIYFRGGKTRYYYGLDSLKLCEGLGLLPIKVIVHWRSGYNAPNIEDLPIITMAEGQIEVITK